METLLKKRRSINSQIKLLETSIADADLREVTMCDYQVQVLALRKENVDLHDLISERSSDKGYEKHEQQFFELAERISRMKIALDVMLANHAENHMDRSMPMLMPASNSVRRGLEVRLPRLDPPTFNGDLFAWLSFHDLFKALIHDNVSLTGAQKLQYLKASLKGEPALLIQSIPIADASYAEAWELLLSRYECKREIIRAQLDRLVTQPSLTVVSPVALRKLIDTTSECVRSLEVMNLPREELFDLMVVHLVSKKLDTESRLQWERSLEGSKLPSFGDFLKFLDNHARVAAAVSTSKGLPKPKPFQVSSMKSSVSMDQGSTSFACEICKGEHAVFRCETFLKMTVQERMDAAKRLRLCFNCLRPGHNAQKCSSGHCRKCQKRHHTLIHIFNPSVSTEPREMIAVTSQVVGAGVVPQVLLATALIRVQDGYGSTRVCRAFLDNGSQGSFITEHCVQRLALQRRHLKVSISGMASVEVGTVRSCVQLVFSALYGTEVFEVTALVLSKISNLLPSFPVQKAMCVHLKGLQLADPHFSEPGLIDVLLGADIYGQLVRHGYHPGGYRLPAAMETALGWVVIGPVGSSQQPGLHSNQIVIHHARVDSEELLQKFWEIEGVPEVSNLTEDERRCEEHFARTYSRNDAGRFIVKLPFRNHSGELGNSRDAALRRFQQVERRYSRDPVLKTQYVDFMEEYKRLGHMTLVSEQQLQLPAKFTCYLPHHAVMKSSSSTTKLRVVFDASAKSSTGVSLNDKLMIGPKLQDDLFNPLVRFRTHRIVFTADIEKMYRQVELHYSEVNFQRILWRKSLDQPVQDYHLTTVTYGTASAPYLAVKSMQQLAILYRECSPRASEILLRDFYMDDLLSGASSVACALEVRLQLSAVLKEGCFQLRKWTSNSSEVMKAVVEELRGTQDLLAFGEDDAVKILGIHWHPASDCFSFVFHHMNLEVCTKRAMLSNLARVYDPLGWLSPLTIRAKIMFQELWKSQVTWDCPLPEDICAKWKIYNSELKTVENIKIERCLVIPNSVVHRICGFCDASQKAYAAAVYLWTKDLNGEVKVVLVTPKTKVAPVKALSLPRLELCAAVLLANLVASIQRTLLLKVESIWCWSDSTIVLAWLAAPSYRWNTFVANRIAKIQEEGFIWQHVDGVDNPADCASRGVASQELVHHQLWWTGPTWLKSEKSFEKTRHAREPPITDLEQRKAVVCLSATIDLSILKKFSSLSTLQRVIAYCLRFSGNAYGQPDGKRKGPLTVLELESSLLKLIKLVQQVEFSVEIHHLKKNKPLPVKSKIRNLNPFCEEDGLLRVGGRLSQSNLAYSAKHPILLPRGNVLTRMIVEREHLRQLHAGPQMLLAVLCQKFWILCGRDVVRHVVQRCMTCHRRRTSTRSQLMADLPSARVLPCVGAFLSTGIDFAGPMLLRVLKGRGQKAYKGYIAIFVCFATRAIHLELVSDLSANAFIATLKRFMARRGKPLHLYSDCGTNFVGSKNKLDDMRKVSQEVCNGDAVHRYLTEEGINWHFNPPGTPHFGGLWEAGVKSMKYHLRRVVGSVMLNFEDMSTVLTQIEACLNSRPLTQVSSDPNDLLPLTPGHFLIGRALTSVPEPDFTALPLNHLSRWQLLQKVVQDFWRLWQSEYLARLQQRPKWVAMKRNLSVGDLVLVNRERLAPLQWKLGRVTQLHSGPDQLVRVVSLKTSDGECKCPIVKISPLPLEVED